MKSPKKTDNKVIKPVKINKHKQVEFLEQYYVNNFNVTHTCDAIGIVKGTFYYWLHNDEAFAKEFNKANTFITNLIVSGFIEGITDPNLSIRVKYLSAIPQRILLKAFGENPDSELSIKVNDIEYKIK